MADIVRLFKLESGHKGSHIHFREFEILLFKVAKLLFRDAGSGPEEKYFKLVQRVLAPEQGSLEPDFQYQRRRKRRPKPRPAQPKPDASRFLPEIVEPPPE